MKKITNKKLSRNAFCPCGSGLKFKKCCLDKVESDVTAFNSVLNEPEQTQLDLLYSLFKAGDYVELENQATILIEQFPDSGYVWKVFASVLFVQKKDIPTALAAMKKAAELLPNDAETHRNLGVMLVEFGLLKEAEESIRRALEIAPTYIDAHYTLALIDKAYAVNTKKTPLLAIEKIVLKNPTFLSNEQTVQLYFTLGKNYHNAGDYQKAFPYFLKGCKAKRASLEYDSEGMDRHFASITQIFNQELINSLKGYDIGNNSALPIFVVGMPRSGTTLTEQIISSHSEVHGAGELPDMRIITNVDISHEKLLSLDAKQLKVFAEGCLSRLQRYAPDAHRITDKMPSNFFAIGLIHLMLPNAKIIHVNRNAMDNCLSCLTTKFVSENEYTYDMTELARYYLNYKKLMAHWRKILPENAFLDIDYEELVAYQEVQSRRIIQYCGLEWDEACLDFHKNKRQISTASLVQVRKPMYSSSVGRWRYYEPFIEPLLNALGDLHLGV